MTNISESVPRMSEHPPLILGGTTPVWRHRQFLQWWDVPGGIVCAFVAMLVSVFLFLFTIIPPSLFENVLTVGNTIIDLELSGRWVIIPTAGMVFFVLYLSFLIPAYRMAGDCLAMSRVNGTPGRRGVQSLLVEYPGCERVVLGMSTIPSRRSERPLQNAVRRFYDSWSAGRGVSLVCEDGRSREYEQSPVLIELIGLSFQTTSLGEAEPVTLPFHVRMGVGHFAMALLMPLSISGVFDLGQSSASGVSFESVVLENAMLGIASAMLLVLGYLGLRELGLFPLPLFRGECSAEKTRVFHRFRWKTFKPGRDLAILRFTSNREADIAFLGVDGSHATARVGGKYLDHFIACWASPAGAPGCESSP